MTKQPAALIAPDATGAMQFYVMSDEGAKLLLSPKQQTFLKASFLINDQPLQPSESVQFTIDGERLGAFLGWPPEDLIAVGLELQQFGVLTVRQIEES